MPSPVVAASVTFDDGQVEMIRIRATDSECEISGAPADLRRVAQIVERVSRSGVAESLPASPDIDPRPYLEALADLRVIRTTGLERVSREAGSLVLSAAPDGLARMASLFDMHDDLEDGYHCHHEPVWDSGAASDSLPLVVSVEREQRAHPGARPNAAEPPPRSGTSPQA